MKKYSKMPVVIRLVGLFISLGLAGYAMGSPMGVPEHNADRPGSDIMPGFSSSHWNASSTSCATNDQRIILSLLKAG